MKCLLVDFASLFPVESDRLVHRQLLAEVRDICDGYVREVLEILFGNRAPEGGTPAGLQSQELIPQGFAWHAAEPPNLPRDEVSRLECYHLPVRAGDSAKLPFREVRFDGRVHTQSLILHPFQVVKDEVGQFLANRNNG